MAPSNDKKYFFIHVMKTGGTSFVELLRNNFLDSERYPNAPPETEPMARLEGYMHVPKFVANVNESVEQLRLVSGHVPYAVHSMLKGEYETLTVLRHPVDRIISYLKHCRRYHMEQLGLPLEEIYDNSWFRASFIQNYQTKIFSMTAQETLAHVRVEDGSPRVPFRHELGEGESFSPDVDAYKQTVPARFLLEFFTPCTGVIQVNEKRLATAKQSLDEIGVVGVTENYDQFVSQLESRFNWKVSNLPRLHTGEEDDIPAEFRRRIAQDNEADIELHEYAKSLAR
ncbi:MAG: hypothetical protein ACI9JM_000866 [Halioglobus sp.]|jgi:hypothetical protein